MRFRMAARLATLLCPAVLAAQGGMGGGRGGMPPGGMGGPGGRSEAPARQRKLSTAKEIERLNPAKLLLDKRKKLSLSDSQAAALLLLQQRLYERNAATLAVYDSIRKEIKLPAMPAGGMGGGPGRGGRPGMGGPPGMGGAPTTEGTRPSDEETAKLRMQMQSLQVVVKQLLERRQLDVTETLSLVLPGQAKKAEELIGDQNEAFDKLLPPSRDATPRAPQNRERERR
mgnify:CR=1 FL=1